MSAGSSVETHGESKARVECLGLVRHRVTGDADNGDLDAADVLDDVRLVHSRTLHAGGFVVVIQVIGHRREVGLDDMAVRLGPWITRLITVLTLTAGATVHPGDGGAIVWRKLESWCPRETLTIYARTPAEIPVAGQECVDIQCIHHRHDGVAQREQHLRAAVRGVTDYEQKVVGIIRPDLPDQRGQFGHTTAVGVQHVVFQYRCVRCDMAMHIRELHQRDGFVGGADGAGSK